MAAVDPGFAPEKIAARFGPQQTPISIFVLPGEFGIDATVPGVAIPERVQFVAGLCDTLQGLFLGL